MKPAWVAPLIAVLVCSPFSSAQSHGSTATIHQLFQEDQGDQQIDFDALAPAEQQKLRARYKERESTVKEVMQNTSPSAQDFFDAGVILTHSHDPENQLLAHLAFTAASFGGINEAKHLAATSLDRYLLFSKQTPLFGTIFQIPYQGWHHEVSPSMNDSLRTAFCVPSRTTLDALFEQETKGTTPAANNGRDLFWDDSRKGCN